MRIKLNMDNNGFMPTEQATPQKNCLEVQGENLDWLVHNGGAKISPLALAYIGDAVYELAVREYLLTHSAAKVGQLHERAVAYVRAERQSALYAEIEALLSQEEHEVFRRGRNARGGHQPPHVSVGAYRRSTGLEALIGHLYLHGEEARLQQIFSILFEG